MNKFKKEQSEKKILQNLNIYSAVLSLTGDNKLLLIQKKKFGVLMPSGGVSLYGIMNDFSSNDEKYSLFQDALYLMFHRNGIKLFDISNECIKKTWKKISKNIKNDPAKFNAMLENIEETGRIFYKDMELVAYQKINDHEKFIFFSNDYMFFSKVGDNNFDLVTVFEPGLDKYPIEGRDFFCQDEDVALSNVLVDLKSLMESFLVDGDLSKRYGRGVHREALKKIIEKSNLLFDPENRDLIYAFEKI